jgi:hypothetical protein
VSTKISQARKRQTRVPKAHRDRARPLDPSRPPPRGAGAPSSRSSTTSLSPSFQRDRPSASRRRGAHARCASPLATFAEFVHAVIGITLHERRQKRRRKQPGASRNGSRLMDAWRGRDGWGAGAGTKCGEWGRSELLLAEKKNIILITERTALVPWATNSQRMRLLRSCQGLLQSCDYRSRSS